MQKMISRMLPFLVIAAFFLSGCAQESGKTASAVKPAAVTQKKVTGPVYKGRVVGKSNKAKTISIEVGKGSKAKTMMVKFDENTDGIEHATKGHGVIVSYEKQGKDIYAKSIKPKLAKMPKGVSTVTTAELTVMIDGSEDFVLVDSRPAHRYGTGHLPGAISIPVCEMQELLGLLPKDPNRKLVFYCGGPT
ncbi:MAG: rhodanese-like domain-containing protein [Deltaproteobacteria bacterium]|nr:rhodanese-like domain-containing protein [Deltaproteobacteria bacterium]